MNRTLLEGDFVIVSKLSYGPRIPRVIKLPFISYESPLLKILNIQPYLRVHNNDIRLFKGEVDRNDVMAFDPPDKEPNISGLYVPYIKRCVALPGDTLRIENGRLIVNNKEYETYFEEYVITKKGDSKILNQYIMNVPGQDSIVLMNTSNSEIQRINDADLIQSYSKTIISSDINDLDVFPYSVKISSNKDHIPQFVIPKKGMTMRFDSQNLAFYKNLLLDYEGCSISEQDNGIIKLNGEDLGNYTFKNDYFFAVGDNWEHSIDSRYFGMFPRKSLIGKVKFIWFSKGESIRWDRVFSKI